MSDAGAAADERASAADELRLDDAAITPPLVSPRLLSAADHGHA